MTVKTALAWCIDVDCWNLKPDFVELNMTILFFRYNNDLELEDAIHTAILTLKVCKK